MKKKYAFTNSNRFEMSFRLHGNLEARLHETRSELKPV